MLDSVSYELTEARRVGVDEPDRLRSALKKARDHLDDADALVGAIVATQEH